MKYDPKLIVAKLDAYKKKRDDRAREKAKAKSGELEAILARIDGKDVQRQIKTLIDAADRALDAEIDLSGFIAGRYDIRLVAENELDRRRIRQVASFGPSVMLRSSGEGFKATYPDGSKCYPPYELAGRLACARNFLESWEKFQDSLYGYLDHVVST